MTLWVALLFGLLKPPAPATHTVEIRGMEFHPAVLTVAVGDTVVWVNHDIVPHTSTASGRAKAWDTGQLTQGQSGRFVVQRTARGRIRYSCTFHPTMRGTLIVR